MASLSAGVLQRLLRDMEPPSASKDEATASTTAGRDDDPPALLQVTGIIPALTGDDLFANHGFYLQVSDSTHSTYVSLHPDQNDLILSDRLQLGQLICVRHLESASPVPLLGGLDLVPGRHPCLRGTADIVVVAAPIRSMSDPIGLFPPSTDPLLALPPQPEEKKQQQRRSTGASKTEWKKKGNGAGVPPRSRSIPTSPVSGAAKKRGIERGSSEVLSELKKISVSTITDDQDSDDSNESRISCSSSSSSFSSSSCCVSRPKTVRKSWDSKGRMKERSRNPKPIVRSRSPSVSPRKVAQRGTSKTEDETLPDLLASQRDTERAFKVLCSSAKRKLSSSNIPCAEGSSAPIPGSISNGMKWPEQNLPWASLPSSLVKHGKEVLKQRDLALHAAVDALQEACASQRLIRCLSMYSELQCNKEDDPQHLVDSFLDFHNDLVQAKLITQSLPKLGPFRTWGSNSATSASVKETAKVATERRKCAASWIKAAFESDLSEYPSESNTDAEPFDMTSVDEQILSSITSIYKQRKNSENWLKRCGSLLVADTGTALQGECNRWFLKYLDKFLDSVESETDDTACQSQFPSFLCQLKRVDDWINTINSKESAWPSDRCKENTQLEDEDIEACERVRKKIYGILLRHVHNAAMALESMNFTA